MQYRATIERELGCQVVAVDEMEALVRGIEFVVSNLVGECYTYKLSPMSGVDLPDIAVGERWTHKVARPADAMDDIFPYLLVSIGSGVSIVRVDAPGVFSVRVCGGGGKRGWHCAQN